MLQPSYPKLRLMYFTNVFVSSWLGSCSSHLPAQHRRTSQTMPSSIAHLPSADIRTCVVPRTKAWFRDRSISTSGPKIWKSVQSTHRPPGFKFCCVLNDILK